MKTGEKKIVLVVLGILGLCVSVCAQAETMTYVFDLNQSTVLERNWAWGYYEKWYSVEGEFQLTVNFNAGTAWFEWVDANLSEEIYYFDGGEQSTQSLDVLFHMSELVSTDVDNTEINFVFEKNNPTFPFADVHLQVTFIDDLAHLTGRFSDDMYDGDQYDLDAFALKYTSSQVSWIPGEVSPPDWGIEPTNPTTRDVIYFWGPTEVFSNSCVADGAMGGTPTLTIDPVNKTIELWFQPPAPGPCPAVYDPVCGLQGSFGPLEAGQWLFFCNQLSFSISFQVGWYYEDDFSTTKAETDSYDHSIFWPELAYPPGQPWLYYSYYDLPAGMLVLKGYYVTEEDAFLAYAFPLDNLLTRVDSGIFELDVLLPDYSDPLPPAYYLPPYIVYELSEDGVNWTSPLPLVEGHNQIPLLASNNPFTYIRLSANSAKIDNLSVTVTGPKIPVVYHVDVVDGNDLNDGLTPETAFATIQKGIDTAQDGYTVLVWPGVYTESIDFLGKNIMLTSTDPANITDVVNNTIIVGSVQFSGTEDTNCTLTGFSISDLENGAIYGNHTQATISYCVISGNGPCGATVLENCDGTISNCVITDNTTAYWCGVYPVVFGCHGLIKNCTIANNISGVCVLAGGTTTIEDSIIYNNGDPNDADPQVIVGSGGTVNISYCDVQGGLEGISGGGTVNWGLGNIDTDPRFVQLGYWQQEPFELIEGDYHLKSEGWRWDVGFTPPRWGYDYVTSRCIDAGNPGCALGDELLTVLPEDPDNDWGVNLRINMGAYGGTAEASMAPHGWALLADLSNNGIVSYLDLAGQVEDWLISASEQPGDLNRDGVVNGIDFAMLGEDWLRATKWANWPPEVYITQPQDGAVISYALETIDICADAWDPDGSVVKVEFFANGSKIGQDNDGADGWGMPWFSFNECSAYSLTAKATDNEGATTASPAVGIIVECNPEL